MGTAFGLDFGTTNSALAVSQNGKVEIIDINFPASLQKTLKSVIFFDEERNVSVGQEAIDEYVEHDGAHGRFMQSIKAFLPNRNFTETYVFGKRFEIEDLIALILKEIKRRGEIHVGHTVDTVVLGRPVIFSENKDDDRLAEERLRAAAFRSGFTNVHFIYEPIAATLAYEAQLPKNKEELVFMGDFGGGTSDFVVMRLCGGGYVPREDREKDVLAVGGVYVAGDSFDASIMWHKLAYHFGKGAKILESTKKMLDVPVWIPQTLCQWHMIPQLREKRNIQIIRNLRGATDDDRQALSNLNGLVSGNLGYALFRAIEETKCELSINQNSSVSFVENNIVIREDISRGEFELIADDKFEQIRACIDDTLCRAKVSPQEIDSVLLTGGSSFIPGIQKIFLDKFGDKKLLPIDAFTSVAYGLGIIASKY